MRNFLVWLKTPVVLIRRLAVGMFGSLQWTPPHWPGVIARRRTWVLAILCILGVAGYGAAQWYAWREAHRPRPRELVQLRTLNPKVTAPPVPGWDAVRSKLVARPLSVRFSEEAAPLDLVGKPVEGVAELDPAIAGEWRWASASELVFLPTAAWPAGVAYTVKLKQSGMAASTELAETKFEFRTEALKGEADKPAFHTDPTDPTRHFAVLSVRFNQPVQRSAVIAHLGVDVVGGTKLFTEGSTPEVTADAKDPRQFHLRSPLITIPAMEDFVRFRIAPDITAMAGGAGTETEISGKVTVPTRETGFVVKSANSSLVPDEDGEPQQFLFLQTNRLVDASVIGGKVEAWELPELPEKVEAWTPATVTPEILAKASRVQLQLAVEETEGGLADAVAFRLSPRAPGLLWVRVPAGTPAPGGFVLGADYACAVHVSGFPKEVSIIGEGGVLALGGERKLSVKSRGLDHVRFTLGRVPASQINHLVSQTNGDFQAPYFRGGSFGMTNLARMQRTVISVARENDHEASYSAFDFAPELARPIAGDTDTARGLFFVKVEGVRPRGEDDEHISPDDPDPKWVALCGDGSIRAWDAEDDAGEGRFLLVTDLGLVVKRNADGTREVFVASFQQRGPIAGATVVALARNGEPLAQATTDAEGRASLPALDGLKRERKAVAIIVRHGSDLAFLPWARADRAVETSNFDTGGIPASETRALDAFLFTERGVYRPGDAIHVGAVVRQRDWMGMAEGVPMEVTLRNPSGQLVETTPLVVGKGGIAEVRLETRETSPTGVWMIGLQRRVNGDETEYLGQHAVRVEEFLPDRLKLSASWNKANAPGWLSPKDLAVKLEAATLFDLPAADRTVEAKLRLVPAVPEFAGWDGWRFHLPQSQPWEGKELPLPERKTDAQGRAELALHMEGHEAPLLEATVEVEAFEADGGRGVRTSLNALISPHSELIGWKAEGDVQYLRRDVPTQARLVAINAELKPVEVRGLTRLLMETRLVSVLTRQENGTLSYTTKPREVEKARAEVSLNAGENPIELPVGQAGKFRYEWRNAAGVVLCALPFEVVGPQAGDVAMQRDGELEGTLPRREWRSGEELEIALRAPYAGLGLITIERDRVLASKWFQTDAASSVQRIRIPEGLEGGAYVHVALVRRLDAPEIFTNPLSVCVLPFRVALDRRKLAVELDAPAKVRPGEALKIGVRSTRASRVVVWAVDDGIHRVTNYRAPEPLAHFFRRRSLEVGTWQLLDLLLPEYSLLQQTRAFGGDGDDVPELKLGLNPFKRKRYAPVVFWSGFVDCGPDRTEVTYSVPEHFAGKLNLFAMAIAPDAIGVAERGTVVKGPFVLTPNVPVFAAPGDEFIASLTVANQTEPAVTQVEIAMTPSENLEVIEAPASLTDIPGNAEATLRYRVRVKSALGNAELRFSAKAGAEKTELSSTLSVRPATPAQTWMESGWFREDRFELPVGRALHPEFAKREVVVSSTPMGLGAGLRNYLGQFPHGCTEQTTSKAFPWLLTRGEVLEARDQAEASEAIARACAILSVRQHANGGFGYWTSEDGLNGIDPLTVYVGHFLTEAQAGGHPVPPHLLSGTMRRLKAMASHPITQRHEANLQAAAIYLLARNGTVTTSYALNLIDTLRKEHREEWLADTSAAWLAANWMVLKMEKEGRALFAQHRGALSKKTKPPGRPTFYESPLAQSAQTFVVMCRHFPDVAGSMSYDDLRPVTEPLQRGDFHTYSAAWTVMALKSYGALVKSGGMRVSAAEQVGREWRALGDTMPAVFSEQAQRLQFRRDLQGGAPDLGVWYQAMEYGFARELPKAPETRGLEIVREFIGADGKAANTAKVGETLHLRLRVRNVNALPQPHIAVVDLLPAGFENVPGDLRPGLRALGGADYVDCREDRNLLFVSLKAGESRTLEWTVRPTAAGTMVVPPAFAEAMYDRAVSGNSAAGTFTVLPR